MHLHSSDSDLRLPTNGEENKLRALLDLTIFHMLTSIKTDWVETSDGGGGARLSVDSGQELGVTYANRSLCLHGDAVTAGGREKEPI